LNTFEYEQLVSQYADSVYRLALSSCKNPADAEDMVQNTFLKLWLRSEGFADLPAGEYTLILSSIYGASRADAPLLITGSWQCSIIID